MAHERVFSRPRLIAAILFAPLLTHLSLAAFVCAPIVLLGVAGLLPDINYQVLLGQVAFVGIVAVPITYMGVGCVLAPLYYRQAKRLKSFSEANLMAFGVLGVPVVLTLSAVLVSLFSGAIFHPEEVLSAVSFFVLFLWPFGLIYALVATAYFIWITRPRATVTL